MHEAAKNKREADANRVRLEAEIKMTESTVENDLNNERRKKLQEKQRVRRQVEDEISELTSELFSKKVCGVDDEGTQFWVIGLVPDIDNMYGIIRRIQGKAFDTKRTREKRKCPRPLHPKSTNLP